jgi:fructose-bisphosphate aldolase, class I
VFLSGGQGPQAATAHLNAMNAMPMTHPWQLGFSFARALQAQRAFHHRARCNSAAREGRYTPGLEQAADPLSGERSA